MQEFTPNPTLYKNWVGLCGEWTAVTKKMSLAQLWRTSLWQKSSPDASDCSSWTTGGRSENEWERLPFQSWRKHSLKHLEKFHVKKAPWIPASQQPKRLKLTDG